MNIDISVLGIGPLAAHLAEIATEVGIARAKGSEAAAEVIREAWQANIESEGLVLTGRYLDSITVSRDGDEVVVSSDVPYAGILEYGDSRQAAHPVAERAAEEHASEAFDVIGDHVREAIR